MKPITVMSRNGKQHYELLLLRVANGTATIKPKQQLNLLRVFFGVTWNCKEKTEPKTVELLYNEPSLFLDLI